MRRRGPARPAGRAPHRSPLPGGPRRLIGASIATLRLVTFAIAKVHELAEPWTLPARIRGVRESLKGWGRDVWLEASAPGRRPHRRRVGCDPAHRRPKPRAPRPRLRNTSAGRLSARSFDLALVAVLSDGGLRRSEAAALTWGDVQRWDDGSGRITVVRSKTDVEAVGAVVAVTPAAMKALDAMRPEGVGGAVKVFGLSESQIARRVKAVARCRRSGGLGVLQRPQRAGGHGPAHGPEWRAHPRDRTPGPLETGRRHGRPLHSQRNGRVGPAVSVANSCNGRHSMPRDVGILTN